MGVIDTHKKILTLISFCIIGLTIFFLGCIEDDNTLSKGTTEETATSTSGQEDGESTPALTPTALPISKTVHKTDMTLKPGYKWYQDDELGYKIGYPEDWEKMPNMGLTKGQESAVMFMPADLEPDPQNMGMPYITIIIYSDSTQSRWWDNPSTNGNGSFSISEGMKVSLSLENGTEMGIISDYGPVTINGRDGFEVVLDPVMFVGFSTTPVATSRYVVFTVDNLDYTVSTVALNDMDSTYEGIFEDVINSFIIE